VSGSPSPASLRQCFGHQGVEFLKLFPGERDCIPEVAWPELGHKLLDGEFAMIPIRVIFFFFGLLFGWVYLILVFVVSFAPCCNEDVEVDLSLVGDHRFR
jgi:hypothetical protein